jgi:hypothetical protein
MAISLAVKIWGDSTPLLTELEKVKKNLTLLSKELTKMGSQLTQALTLPIVAFGAIAVKEFGEAEKASVTLSAALTANGKNAEELSSQYHAFAEELSKLTTVSRDSAIGLLALAENMKAPDAKKATQDAIGLSQVYGVDMTRAMKIAIQAQEGQYTLLQRIVPALKNVTDEAQKHAMAEKILSDAFSGAKAQATSGLGPLEQMKNTIAELSESFGKIIVTGITPMINGMKSFAEWMDSLSETTKKWIVTILATVAIIGPLLLVLGKIPIVISSIINGVTLLAGAFKAVGVFLISNPWVALAVAIAAAGAALGYFLAKAGDARASNTEQDKTMEAMRKRQEDDAAETRKYMAEDEDGRKKMIDGLRNEANEYVKLYGQRKAANDTTGMEHYKEQVENINALVAQMKDAQTDASKGVVASTTAEGESIDKEKDKIDLLKKEVKDLTDEYLKEVAAHSVLAPKTLDLLTIRTKELDRLEQLTKNEQEYIKWLLVEDAAVKMHGAQHLDDTGTNVPGMVSTPGSAKINPQKGDAQGAVSQANAAITASKTLSGVIGTIQTKLGDMTGSLGPLATSFSKTFSSIGTLIQDVASKFADGWASAVQDIGNVVQSVMGTIGSIISTSFADREKTMTDYYSDEKDAIDNSTMSEKEKSAALTKIGKEEQKERKKLLREQAKDQKDVALVQAIIAAALGIVTSLAQGGILGIAMAAIVGVLGAIEVAEIASQPLPSLAEGGLAFAPTMAMVGDNPNASMDPEVIAPFSKLRSLIQGTQDVNLHGVLKGADIYLSSERGGVQVQRIRGH